MSDLLDKAMEAFNALSSEQQAEMLEETRKSFAENNVALSRPAAPVEGLEPIAWPINLVNMPDTDDADARILGFRIRAGDEAFGEYGLSEALQWLKKACMDSVYGAQAETIIAAKDEALNGLLQALKHHTGDNHGLMAIRKLVERYEKAEADNAALTARVKELTSPEYLTEKLEQVGVVDNEWQERAETLETQLAAARKALKSIADAPAWGFPEKWETTPAEVRQLARAALEAKP